MADVTAVVHEVIRNHLMMSDGEVLDPQANLNDLGLDSLAKVAIMVDIESRLEVTIPEELIVERNFTTPQAIARLAEQVVAGQEPR